MHNPKAAISGRSARSVTKGAEAAGDPHVCEGVGSTPPLRVAEELAVLSIVIVLLSSATFSSLPSSTCMFMYF